MIHRRPMQLPISPPHFIGRMAATASTREDDGGGLLHWARLLAVAGPHAVRVRGHAASYGPVRGVDGWRTVSAVCRHSRVVAVSVFCLPHLPSRGEHHRHALVDAVLLDADIDAIAVTDDTLAVAAGRKLHLWTIVLPAAYCRSVPEEASSAPDTSPRCDVGGAAAFLTQPRSREVEYFVRCLDLLPSSSPRTARHVDPTHSDHAQPPAVSHRPTAVLYFTADNVIGPPAPAASGLVASAANHSLLDITASDGAGKLTILDASTLATLSTHRTSGNITRIVPLFPLVPPAAVGSTPSTVAPPLVFATLESHGPPTIWSAVRLFSSQRRISCQTCEEPTGIDEGDVPSDPVMPSPHPQLVVSEGSSPAAASTVHPRGPSFIDAVAHPSDGLMALTAAGVLTHFSLRGAFLKWVDCKMNPATLLIQTAFLPPPAAVRQAAPPAAPVVIVVGAFARVFSADKWEFLGRSTPFASLLARSALNSQSPPTASVHRSLFPSAAIGSTADGDGDDGAASIADWCGPTMFMAPSDEFAEVSEKASGSLEEPPALTLAAKLCFRSDAASDPFKFVPCGKPALVRINDFQCTDDDERRLGVGHHAVSVVAGEPTSWSHVTVRSGQPTRFTLSCWSSVTGRRVLQRTDVVSPLGEDATPLAVGPTGHAVFSLGGDRIAVVKSHLIAPLGSLVAPAASVAPPSLEQPCGIDVRYLPHRGANGVVMEAALLRMPPSGEVVVVTLTTKGVVAWFDEAGMPLGTASLSTAAGFNDVAAAPSFVTVRLLMVDNATTATSSAALCWIVATVQTVGVAPSCHGVVLARLQFSASVNGRFACDVAACAHLCDATTTPTATATERRLALQLARDWATRRRSSEGDTGQRDDSHVLVATAAGVVLVTAGDVPPPPQAHDGATTSDPLTPSPAVAPPPPRGCQLWWLTLMTDDEVRHDSDLRGPSWRMRCNPICSPASRLPSIAPSIIDSVSLLADGGAQGAVLAVAYCSPSTAPIDVVVLAPPHPSSSSSAGEKPQSPPPQTFGGLFRDELIERISFGGVAVRLMGLGRGLLSFSHGNVATIHVRLAESRPPNGSGGPARFRHVAVVRLGAKTVRAILQLQRHAKREESAERLQRQFVELEGVLSRRPRSLPAPAASPPKTTSGALPPSSVAPRAPKAVGSGAGGLPPPSPPTTMRADGAAALRLSGMLFLPAERPVGPASPGDEGGRWHATTRSQLHFARVADSSDGGSDPSVPSSSPASLPRPSEGTLSVPSGGTLLTEQFESYDPVRLRSDVASAGDAAVEAKDPSCRADDDLLENPQRWLAPPPAPLVPHRRPPAVVAVPSQDTALQLLSPEDRQMFSESPTRSVRHHHQMDSEKQCHALVAAAKAAVNDSVACVRGTVTSWAAARSEAPELASSSAADLRLVLRSAIADMQELLADMDALVSGVPPSPEPADPLSQLRRDVREVRHSQDEMAALIRRLLTEKDGGSRSQS